MCLHPPSPPTNAAAPPANDWAAMSDWAAMIDHFRETLGICVINMVEDQYLQTGVYGPVPEAVLIPFEALMGVVLLGGVALSVAYFLFDLRIFLSADLDVCMAALKERNKCIPGYTEEEIEVRCDA